MPDDQNTPAEGQGEGQAPPPEGDAPSEPTDGSVEDALEAAKDTVQDTQAEVDKAGGGKSFTPPELTPSDETGEPVSGLDLLSDVNLDVKIELGRTRLLVEDVLRLGEGAVVELEKLAGDPVDIYVNERHVARGEVLVLNDNFCVRVSEILDGLADAARSAARE